jgi:hypothetical protein
MEREDIIFMAEAAGLFGNPVSTEGLEHFASLVATAERNSCIDLLMGLHQAQSNNGAHNYYHFASNAIKDLRGKTITIKSKQFKCTGCQGKWHNSEDAKHHSCKDYQ